ncbi:MAG: hypothetical protein NW241_00340 [Bacteroidia bacterium]|nr:hypothetical protein [Bacteroidia bacterium]
MKHIHEIIASYFLEPEQSEALELLRDIPFASELENTIERVRKGNLHESLVTTSEQTLRRINSFLAQEKDSEKKRALENLLSRLIRCVLLDLAKQYPEKLSGVITALKDECYRQQYDFKALEELLNLKALIKLAEEQRSESEVMGGAVQTQPPCYLRWLKPSEDLHAFDQLLLERGAIHRQGDFSALFDPNSNRMLCWPPEHFEFMLVLLDKLWKGQKPIISSPPESKAFWDIIARRCKAGEKVKTAKGLATQLSKLKKTEKFERYNDDCQGVVECVFAQKSNPMEVVRK